MMQFINILNQILGTKFNKINLNELLINSLDKGQFFLSKSTDFDGHITYCIGIDYPMALSIRINFDDLKAKFFMELGDVTPWAHVSYDGWSSKFIEDCKFIPPAKFTDATECISFFDISFLKKFYNDANGSIMNDACDHIAKEIKKDIEPAGYDKDVKIFNVDIKNKYGSHKLGITGDELVTYLEENKLMYLIDPFLCPQDIEIEI